MKRMKLTCALVAVILTVMMFPAPASVSDRAFAQISTELWAVEYRLGDPPPGFSFADWPIIEVWMNVRIENRGPGDAFNVIATVVDCPLNTNVPDPEVSVGNIPVGGSAWSVDPFTARVDVFTRVDRCDMLFWRIEYDDRDGIHHVVEPVPQFPPGEGPCDDPPTAITLTSFDANAGTGEITLAWESGTEIDNAGYNLYRAPSANGPWTKINSALIAAQGDAVAGAKYSFVDTPGFGTFFYKLEDVDFYGASELHGPVAATLSAPFRRPQNRPTLPW